MSSNIRKIDKSGGEGCSEKSRSKDRKDAGARAEGGMTDGLTSGRLWAELLPLDQSRLT